ncbi:xanthine dehydrogenase family protein molybdopterin-binding subunit [Pseudomarimonas arenosa]|uniref:Xanthine dehydrogenase family protein molybdopterin-binding subunit n=1 Tax=Pseudomarimonas arenosa TaxID=2774145 RepID=A0AAW3ZLZ0_9GAMM|nr:molybdopterin cofactor-binding domain-containing protein [Pseudomarimonas arenosa]MBD8527071.1 xanthine dehydrogenase family protein molybdopterin-binding subunit [Pseudomarimonas arenosa]
MKVQPLSRRHFLRLTSIASTGLFLGFGLGCAEQAGPLKHKPTVRSAQLSAFLNIDTDGLITLIYKKTEMGQGVRTLAAVVVAEELDAPLAQIRVVNPSPSSTYGGMETGGSYTAAYTFNAVRGHLATVRQMLCQAAAQQWGVALNACATEQGRVVNRHTGETLGYGALAEAAAKLTPPTSAPTKQKQQLRLLGKSHPNQHNRDMVTGQAKYGIDHAIDGMLHASLVRAPVVGGRLLSFDDTECRTVPGFVRAVAIEGTQVSDFPEYIRSSVAVLATNSWSAMQAAQKLQVEWQLGQNQEFASVGYMQELRDLAQLPGLVFREEGTLESAMAAADQVLNAEYSGPFLAHAPMEPMNCTASLSAERCEIWVPCHAQNRLLEAVKSITGLAEDAIQIHTTLIGGSFGRRLQVDYAIEALLISSAAAAPVKLVWSREQDMRFACYRSPYVQKLSGAVKDGRIVAWEQRIACSSVWKLREPQMLENGLDFTVFMPAKIMAYAIPNIRMSQHITALPVPLAWWRASYPTINYTVQECFLDELIRASGRDPFEARLELLADDQQPIEVPWKEGWGSDVIERGRMARVLRELKAKSGWQDAKSPGQGRGIAAIVYSGTYVAQMVELSVRDNELKLERVVCVVDCGFALNPDNVRAQMEGGIIFGLSAALFGEISFAAGQVQQSNFHDYRILTLAQTPAIEVHIIESDAGVSGVGEPGTHPIMAATCNAIFDACGLRIRDLPIATKLSVV